MLRDYNTQRESRGHNATPPKLVMDPHNTLLWVRLIQVSILPLTLGGSAGIPSSIAFTVVDSANLLQNATGVRQSLVNLYRLLE